MNYLITSQHTLSAARQAGLDDGSLSLSGLAVLTFSKAVVQHLTELCDLRDAEWISQPHHPYAAAGLVRRGRHPDSKMDVIVLVPLMGASPLACILEDLAACGAQVIFLVCAAWSLGPPLAFGDLIVPAFSVGPDGTSIHYGNRLEHISADPQVVEALQTASCKGGARVHVGGNASCEALYRISPQMVEDFRSQGCVCMDNGEASTLFVVTRKLGVHGGVLFQPYIELQQGWDPARLDEKYHLAYHRQAEVALEAGVTLWRMVLKETEHD